MELENKKLILESNINKLLEWVDGDIPNISTIKFPQKSLSSIGAQNRLSPKIEKNEKINLISRSSKKTTFEICSFENEEEKSEFGLEV